MRAMFAAAAIAVALTGGTASSAWAQAAATDQHQGHGGTAAPSATPTPPPPPTDQRGMMAGHQAMMGGAQGMMGDHRRMMHRMMRQRMHGDGMPGVGEAHAGMNMDDGPTDPVAGAFDAINRRMHRDMTPPAGVTPDVAFVTGMIPHHQGAVDMAKVVLAFGSDPEIRKLAEEIIASQAKEIAFMRAWLAKQPQ